MACLFFFFQAEDGIRDYKVTGVQTCALPIWFTPMHFFHFCASCASLWLSRICRICMINTILSGYETAPRPFPCTSFFTSHFFLHCFSADQRPDKRTEHSG